MVRLSILAEKVMMDYQLSIDSKIAYFYLWLAFVKVGSDVSDPVDM